MIQPWARLPEYARLPIIFVGEVNPLSTDPRHALLDQPAGSTGDRLRRLICRMRRTTYCRLGKVDLFDQDMDFWRAKARTVDLLELDVPLVALGSRVANLLNLANQPLYTPLRNAIVLPHPSGRNRIWTPAEFDRAHQALREFAPWIPWGDLDTNNPAPGGSPAGEHP